MVKGIRTFILAAGPATRLYPFSSILPKSLLPVGSKPCIRWIVEGLINRGFTDIVVRVNEDFLGQFEHEFRDLPNVKFSAGKSPLGTAGEILAMKDLIEDKPFLLHYGDELTNIDLVSLVNAHFEKRPLVTLALIKGVLLEVGVVKMDEDGFVTSFEEKPPLPFTTWAGIAVMEPRILSYIKFGDDFAIDVFPRCLRAGEKLYGFVDSKARWLDIGTISHYRRANELARKGAI